MVDGEGRVHRLLSVLITREQVVILSLVSHKIQFRTSAV